jgi:hypothetical protein
MPCSSTEIRHQAYRYQSFEDAMKSIKVGLKAIITAAIVGVSLIAVTPSASAAAPIQTILNIDYTVEYSQVGTKYYDEWQRRYPAQIDWSTDGCSLPGYIDVFIPVFALAYSTAFNNSCVIHDFGYRNYGNGKHHLGKTRYRKNTIDTQFRSNMKHQCSNLSWADLRKPTCNAAADAFYWAVSNHADKAFFG